MSVQAGEQGAEIIQFPVTAVVRYPAPPSDALIGLAFSVALEVGWIEPCSIIDLQGNTIQGYRYTDLGRQEVGPEGVLGAAVALASGARS